MGLDIMNLIKILSNLGPKNNSQSAQTYNQPETTSELRKTQSFKANYNYAAFVARHERLSKEIDKRAKEELKKK